MGGATTGAITRERLSKVPRAVAERGRRALSGEVAAGAAGLGASGAIGGGSAYMQYGKGRKIKKRIEKKAGIPGYIAGRVLAKPALAVGIYRTPERVREGKRTHRKMIQAYKHGYPAGWVALGMRPKRG